MYRLPALVLGLIALPYSYQWSGVAIGATVRLAASTSGDECAGVAYPQKCAKPSTENGVLQILFKSFVNLTDPLDELWHLGDGAGTSAENLTRER